VVFEDHLDQEHHTAGNFCKIELGDIAPDQPIRLERFHPLQASARRQMHSLGKADIAEPRVELEALHDFEVHVVDHVPACHDALACPLPLSERTIA
jgi:hypothetical protein